MNSLPGSGMQNSLGTNPNYPLGPPSPTGGGPMPGGGGGYQMANDNGMAPPYSGMGQSFQSPPSFLGPPQPAQPPNAVTNQVPTVGIGRMPPTPVPVPTSPPRPVPTSPPPQPPVPTSGKDNRFLGPPVPQPPSPTSGPAMSAQRSAQNRMTVHNPTGTGTVQASQMAAAKRPIPANQPTKKQGYTQPTPQNIPGAPK